MRPMRPRPRQRSASNSSTLRRGAKARARSPRAARGAPRRQRSSLASAKCSRPMKSATEAADAGLALDLSEIERLSSEVERHIGAYRAMLDQLSTAVAIFDRVEAAHLP